MFGIGVTELGIILVVALLVFGPKRLPELARMLGRGMGEFRRASNELRQSLALDDLQSDLRRGLDQSGRIHKPVSPPDRPAQAGDDLAAADATDRTTDGVTDGVTDGAVTTDAAAATNAPSPPSESDPDSASPSPARHPGELPLGNDHEHHDPPDDDESAVDAPALSDSTLRDSTLDESTPDDEPRRMSPSGSERG
jgi:TatA/E family protein of Tat protein translocase